MEKDNERRDLRWGIDTTVNHELRIRLTEFTGGSEMQDVLVWVVAPDEITELMARVVSHGGYALADIAHDIVVGDCKTCKNYRLVTEEKNGRDWQVECPDCRTGNPLFPKPAFSHYPVIGGGWSDNERA
jgi:hypothetical protein